MASSCIGALHPTFATLFSNRPGIYDYNNKKKKKEKGKKNKISRNACHPEGIKKATIEGGGLEIEIAKEKTPRGQ